MKITFLDAKTVGDAGHVEVFEKLGDYTFYETTSPEEVLGRIEECEIIITNKVPISREVMGKASQLRLICVAATGMNNVDLQAAEELGIKVKNVEDYSTHSVAQHTFAMLLSLLSRPAFHDHYVYSGQYSKHDIFTYLGAPFWQLQGRRMGIIGLGNIGKKVAQIAEAFEAEVVYYSSSGKNRHPQYQQLDLDELLSTSDVVSVHAPLSEKTRHLITYDKIKRMKPDAILLNTGRGGIIKEDDLARATNERLIRAAGIDVYTQEPLPEDHPYLMVRHPERLLLTPHIAWASRETRELLLQRVADNIRQFAQGKN
ncbi:MAG: D-2-hydroxyacid dehydrogenase [Cyclobacteriaceae bacterium]